jgi:NAD kinase
MIHDSTRQEKPLMLCSGENRMTKQKILVVRKMSALEYYYQGKHKNPSIIEGAKNHDRNIVRIAQILKKEGQEFEVVTRRALSEKLVRSYDAVISAGGDGTVIATAAYNKQTPQLNLKTDSRSVGALCQEDIQNAIRNFLSGDYALENWTRQDVYLDGKFVGRASNEVCVGEGLKFSKLAKYDITCVNSGMGIARRESQSGSGLVIATGTGSSGWPAAFKPFPRNSPYFEFRTLLLHSGIIDYGRADNIEINYKGHEGKFAIDTKEYDLPRDSQLEIEVSKYPLPVIVASAK